MQRNLSFGMIDSTNSNNCTPEEKLRKISFHTTDLDDYLNNIPNLESESVEGWTNHTWNLKNNSFSLGQTQKKPFWGNQCNKNTQSTKKSPICRKYPNNRTKYIQKLQQKLAELVNIKNERQKTQTIHQATNAHYMAPKKQIANEKRTTSTSESEYEKYQHNFTSTSLRKEFEKSPLFKVRKTPRQLVSDFAVFKAKNPSEELKLNLRAHFNRSMLTSYEPLSHRQKQISIIPYPVLDSERKPRVRKLSKLQDFKQTFYFKHNPESPLQKQGRQKPENTSFKIKVSEPKMKEQKVLKLKI